MQDSSGEKPYDNGDDMGEDNRHEEKVNPAHTSEFALGPASTS